MDERQQSHEMEKPLPAGACGSGIDAAPPSPASHPAIGSPNGLLRGFAGPGWLCRPSLRLVSLLGPERACSYALRPGDRLWSEIMALSVVRYRYLPGYGPRYQARVVCERNMHIRMTKWDRLRMLLNDALDLFCTSTYRLA